MPTKSVNTRKSMFFLKLCSIKKTSLLRFLNATRRLRPQMIVEFGWDVKSAEFVKQKPADFGEFLEGKKYDRLVLDSLSSVAVMTRDSLDKFITKVKGMGCTAIIISELPKNSEWLSRDTISEFLCDGVVLLKSVEVAGEVKNLIKVEKMRSSKIDKGSHIYNITERGFELKTYKMK